MTIQCKVKSIQPLACNTYQILLHPETPVAFKAGQYLMVVMGEKDKRPFSIASSPCRHEGELELHIGAAEHNAYAGEVVEAMQAALANGTDIAIDAPHGDAWVKEDSQRPLLLIAGGTGFSYVRSILDHCIAQNKSNNIYLYWGARDECQLYAKDELRAIEQRYNNVHFVPVVEQAEADWQGKVGNVLQAINDDFDSLADYDIYIAGRFEMAGSAREQFTQNKQALSDHMYADAYAFI
ncbi:MULTISPECIES: NAD(P)H-flavin reductase [Vibrio]|uniref:NAD(P)H-flavin reductase n=1 Tax=Vibrio proteolyticus NBRC 13287 TaxID=1219065 RepID=U3BSI0_VIBPR|nr:MULTISPECIES: NAD(P)H-flavin reductase [Vibrio]NAW56632.1 NAD(P)H-flavin reductase [Vibrio sp. V36_P2S2PM302]NAX19991.1 NAD(P)H-flavin reductase [Vibrio sp. V39_P1S14PM300]NAX25580.1 NAD(P)H-flavin reductase [Vibrio sp. V38_P2S17PM301]NAX30416.1 NAD(P)H-flavin reductase [Vibrio sp. V37_P2S8PM304]GAD69438.1 NAD(P)H-flavin reductase [Vibrio proteolyticus NBRC 13287]